MITTGERMAELTTRLASLRARLACAAESAGRPVSDVTLLPITKFFPAADVAILWRLGCRAFGEARAQEAAAKIAEFDALVGGEARTAPVHWHMVGQVQRNKARAIAAWADTVHSVDSTKVAAALAGASREALDRGHRAAPLRVFAQISLDGDVSRGGVNIADPAGVDRLCAEISAADGLTLVGLMAVAPRGADPDVAFAALATEHQRVLRDHPGATELSAGMSGDLEAAVRHGSTCVRVGTALMGQRPLTSP